MALRVTISGRRLRIAQRELIDTKEPVLRDALLADFADICDAVVLKQVTDALNRQDIEAALDALDIEPAAFVKYRRAFEQTFIEGGDLVAKFLPRWVYHG